MKLFSHPSFRFFNWQKIKTDQPTEEADAIVLEYTPTGQLRSGLLEVRLLLQVIPSGNRKYITELMRYFPDHELQHLKSGSRIRVCFHLKNPSRVYWMEKKTSGI